jgi:hypothetical protein
MYDDIVASQFLGPEVSVNGPRRTVFVGSSNMTIPLITQRTISTGAANQSHQYIGAANTKKIWEM